MLEALCCISHWWQDLMMIVNLNCSKASLLSWISIPPSFLWDTCIGQVYHPNCECSIFCAFCWVEYSNLSYVSFLAQTCKPLCSWLADSAHETHGYAINFVPVGPGFQAASNDSHTTDSLPCFCSDKNCLEGRIILCCCWVWFICPRKQPCPWASDFW